MNALNLSDVSDKLGKDEIMCDIEKSDVLQTIISKIESIVNEVKQNIALVVE